MEILSLNVGAGGRCLVQFLSFHNLVGFNEMRLREQALPVTYTATLFISKVTLLSALTSIILFDSGDNLVRGPQPTEGKHVNRS